MEPLERFELPAPGFEDQHSSTELQGQTWGESGNRTLSNCFTDSCATTTLLTPLILLHVIVNPLPIFFCCHIHLLVLLLVPPEGLEPPTPTFVA